MLRHAREPVDGQPIENTFLDIDDHTGERLGACTIYCDENAALFPARPFQVRLQLEGDPLSPQLLGASIARGREICAASGKLSRLYTRCAPDDDALMENLAALGFQDNDGLVRLQLRLPLQADFRLPTGSVVVRDDLSDPAEQKFFLERYNELYNTEHDFEWLHSYIDRDGFTRLLTVSPNGIVGEVLLWREKEIGIIGYIQTSKRWRHMGVGSCMIGLACAECERQKLYCVEANARARIPYVLKLFEKMGFRQEELLMRYPGADINP